MNDVTTIACPYCAETIQRAARKCRHCGEMLDPQLRDIAALRAAPSQQVFMNAAVAAPNYHMAPKSRGMAILLALLLGGLGIHKFYLGRGGAGILYLIFCWTFIPACIAFIEAILYALMSEQAFHLKYG